MTVHFSEIEKEVIYLKAIEELINTMVNFEILDLVGNDPESSIRFKSITHQKYFNIVLVDFLSPSDARVIGEQQTYLDALRSICNTPNFNTNESVNSLASATDEFINWLDQEIQVETWLPSINTNAVLSVKRSEFLRICGNISKHNFSRLSFTADDLIKVLKRNKINIDLPDALLSLGQFYERFHTDILSYAASTICEFLNSIRWGIHEYLQPEFSRSMVREAGDSPLYTYQYPNGVENEFAKNCYWDLMNGVRSTPHVRRFKVTRWLKLRY